MKKFYALPVALLCLSLLFCSHLHSQLSITNSGTAFTESFDGMSSSATATIPSGFRVGTDWNTGATATTLAYGTSGTGAVGSSSGGGIINWGNGVTATATDRALGFLNSSGFTSPRSIILKLTNNTGSTISSLAISFDYEKYRTGTREFDWTFFQGTTSAATTSNTSGDQAFVADLANAVVNPPTTTSKSFTITGLSIPAGSDYYLRWTLTGVGGSTNGQGMGIDNFSVTATTLISSNADLSNLTLSSGTLSPAFTSGTTSYTASVPNATSSITLTPTTADGNATVTVNGSPVTSGNSSQVISLNEGDNTITTVVTAQDHSTTKTYTVIVNRTPSGTPTLTTSSPLTGFGSICINTTAGPNSFTLDGSGLDGTDITLSALPGFSYSLTPGGSYNSTLSFSYTGGGFTGKIIYVKFNPTAVQAYDGNIVINGGGISNYTIPATGSGINAMPAVTTGNSSNITATTATVSGAITATGCSAVTGYGIEYSTSSGFPNGSGTPLPGGSLSGGNFSVNLTGLSPNVRYYYHAYATNDGGTSYGTQQAFNAAPLPVAMGSQPGFTYTQDFSDIATWGSFFVSGNGANHFTGLSASGAAAIPDPNRITTSTSNFQSSLSSGGVQKGTDQIPSTQSIVLLSTGSTDNTSSAALDFYLDFTGVNAGTLSFDYQSINNSTGDRNGSLRVYGSTDGTTWTEITNVLNFTNNSPISGSKSNIALPTSFNNNANARIRFYYYNGSGGTTGSRPKISIDNLTVTAVATIPCSTPTAAPTALNFGTTTDVSIAGSFTAASPAADHYLVIASTSNSLTGNPVDGTNYSVGDVVGEGTVVYNGTGTSFTATGLNASTTYYFFVFSYNGVCTGGPLYYAAPLTGQQATNAGLPPCSAPAGQATTLQFGTTNSNSIQGSFTGTTADEYLVLVSTSATLSNNPINGSAYSVGDIIGNGKVVSVGTSTTFTASSLSPSTTYYFTVFSLNSQNCVNGPNYNTTSPLSGSQNTTALPPCSTPVSQPMVLSFNASSNAVSGAFDSGTGADHYLIVRSTSPTLSATPVDNTDYNSGDNLGGGIVVGNISGNSFLATGLSGNTTYYFFVFSENTTCSGGTKYLTTSPLTGYVTTAAPVTYNYYFGNWHAHSDYSDGNKDHPGYTPADDYTYAQTAQCMDYLGISEHNHFSTADNPGNTISNYHLGPVQADNYTSAHPGFIAMYGMEWGVINNGGHVVVYGDGMNELWGWESGSGDWGPTNNYDIYVAKSDYTGANGLFKTVNDHSATNTFATLAHPNNTDYNNIAGTPYNLVADNAIVGTAVESGPANSTNTTYSNPGSSMSYLSYFQTMLAKGYHLGPVIDHDNHYTTFGHTTYSRTAVVAPSLSKTELIKGMHNMHFYATQDCDTKVDFSINTKMMGSIFTDRHAPVISVNLTDATNSTSSAVIKLMFGVPGSGVLPKPVATVTGSTMTFVDENIPNMSTGYYYVDITNGSARVITTPIWFTRNDGAVGAPLPVKLVSFDAMKRNNTVQLTWKTAQEINTKEFNVERSDDGKNFEKIGTVKAVGKSDAGASYNLTDGHPFSGNNFYRLKTVDYDGRQELSRVLLINFAQAYTFTTNPNPASSYFEVTVTNRTEPLNLELSDAAGNVLRRQKITSDQTRVNVNGWSKGFYIIRVSGITASYTQKLIIQ